MATESLKIKISQKGLISNRTNFGWTKQALKGYCTNGIFLENFWYFVLMQNFRANLLKWPSEDDESVVEGATFVAGIFLIKTDPQYNTGNEVSWHGRQLKQFENEKRWKKFPTFSNPKLFFSDRRIGRIRLLRSNFEQFWYLFFVWDCSSLTAFFNELYFITSFNFILTISRLIFCIRDNFFENPNIWRSNILTFRIFFLKIL